MNVKDKSLDWAVNYLTNNTTEIIKLCYSIEKPIPILLFRSVNSE